MKTLNTLLILAASSLMMISCAQDTDLSPALSLEIEASLPQATTKAWKSGEQVGAYSDYDENIRFTSINNGKTATFEGNILNTKDDQIVYFVSPYNNRAMLNAQRDYTLSVPQEQVMDVYTASADNSQYYYMIGAAELRSVKSNIPTEFTPLMSKMNFAVQNDGEDGLKVYSIKMASANGENLFATNATISMNGQNPAEDGYRVADANSSTLSVRVTNPEIITTGHSKVISMAFFPVSLNSGTELEFTIETNKGNYTITKTIGGTSGLSFKKGEYYVTPLQIS